MKKKTTLLLLSILFVSIGLYAQKLVACENYDSAGKASGIYSAWDIKPAGSYIYLHYSQPQVLGPGAWILQIDRDSTGTGKFTVYKKITLKPLKGKHLTVSDVFFSGKGKYKCTVRLNGQVKATTTITVDVKKDMDNVEMDDDDASDTYYYEDSEILFCKSVDKQGNTTGEASTFALGTTKQITLTVYTENDGNPFKTKEVYATIYKNNKVVKEYDLDITPEWTYFSFKHTFTEPGEYVVDLYNGKDVFINSATLTITK